MPWGNSDGTILCQKAISTHAAILQGSSIAIETLPDPVPGAGQLLVAPTATGIFGSDSRVWRSDQYIFQPHDLFDILTLEGALVTLDAIPA